MTAPYTDPSIVQREERYDSGESGQTPEAATLRVNVYTAQALHPCGFMESRVVRLAMAPFVKHAMGWKPPRAAPMQHVFVEDWHGGAWLVLRADMSELEVQARVKLARTIHDPETSQENCCRRKREMLAKEVAA